jgi:hypothetical protein
MTPLRLTLLLSFLDEPQRPELHQRCTDRTRGTVDALGKKRRAGPAVAVRVSAQAHDGDEQVERGTT